MSRSTDPSGIPAFCSRILEVMAWEPFDLGYGISVRKTCSVGWAPYPWCRGAYEAICAEEVIALADAALYRAKGLGRNVGAGILPTEAANKTPSELSLMSVHEEGSMLARIVTTECPQRGQVEETIEAAEPVDEARKA